MKPFIDSSAAIGKRLRQKRCLFGLTQEQLAEAMDISLSYLGEIERGRRPLTLAVAEQLCLLFGGTLDFWYLGLIRSDPLPFPPDLESDAKRALLDFISVRSEEECAAYLKILFAIREMSHL